jgi:NAD(P) transhydrogenase subunit alpha
VTIIAPTNIASELAYHSSQMYAKNVASLIALLTKEGGEPNIDMNDDIVAAVTVTTGGKVVNQGINARITGATA